MLTTTFVPVTLHEPTRQTPRTAYINPSLVAWVETHEGVAVVVMLGGHRVHVNGTADEVRRSLADATVRALRAEQPFAVQGVEP